MRAFLFFLIIFVGSIAFSQYNPDQILGKWHTEEKNGSLLIFKYKNKYYAQALTGPEINNKDVKNPDPKLRDRLLKEIIFLQDFEYIPKKGKYMNGKCYNTRDGKTYKAWMRMKDKNSLELHGYVGFSLLGRSVHWTRVPNT